MSRPFEGLLGNNCELRIIEFLLPLKGMSFNITELSEEANISRPSASKVAKKFVEHGLLKKSSHRSNYYEINPDSPYILIFEELNNLIIAHLLEEETLFQINDKWNERIRKVKIPTREIIGSDNELKKFTSSVQSTSAHDSESKWVPFQPSGCSLNGQEA